MPSSQTIRIHRHQLPALADWLAAQLRPGDIVTLDGPLGAGKTTFSRALGKALTLPENTITSPTFTLVNEYLEGRLPLLHADLYRLGEGEAADRFVDELLDRQAELGAVLWVEWAMLSPHLMVQASLQLRLDFLPSENDQLPEEDTMRQFEILSCRDDWALWAGVAS